jgi:hypothetical protein
MMYEGSITWFLRGLGGASGLSPWPQAPSCFAALSAQDLVPPLSPSFLPWEERETWTSLGGERSETVTATLSLPPNIFLCPRLAFATLTSVQQGQDLMQAKEKRREEWEIGLSFRQKRREDWSNECECGDMG